VDVRILAATHRDLQEMAHQQTFREDLMYRLDVVTIEIPPLRQHREDILPLLGHFLQTFRAKFPNSPLEGFSAAALARLMDYPWPGNVRELAHLVQRMVVLGRNPTADLEDLPQAMKRDGLDPNTPFTEVIPARDLLHRYAVWALERLGSNKSRTAESLGIETKTLNRWLRNEGVPDQPQEKP
jgi:two-component system response regulator HydG